MSLDSSVLPWLLSVVLLVVRLTVALALSPALASYGVPGTVRMAIVMALATLTFAGRPAVPEAEGWARDPSLLLVPVFAEALIGALLGFGVHVVLAAFAFAGRLLDLQIGFSIGSVFDPVTRTSANVLGSMMSLLGITLFFAMDAHIALVELVVRSVDLLPLGRMPEFDEPMRPLLAAGSLYALGLALAAPVVMALLLTDLAVGVASRNLAQVNVLLLAMSLKGIVGYVVLAASVLGWAPLARQGFSAMSAYLEGR